MAETIRQSARRWSVFAHINATWIWPEKCKRLSKERLNTERLNTRIWALLNSIRSDHLRDLCSLIFDHWSDLFAVPMAFGPTGKNGGFSGDQRGFAGTNRLAPKGGGDEGQKSGIVWKLLGIQCDGQYWGTVESEERNVEGAVGAGTVGGCGKIKIAKISGKWSNRRLIVLVGGWRREKSKISKISGKWSNQRNDWKGQLAFLNNDSTKIKIGFWLWIVIWKWSFDYLSSADQSFSIWIFDLWSLPFCQDCDIVDKACMGG